MVMPNADFSPVRFSSAGLPARDRVAITREVFGRQIVGLDIAPLEDRPLAVEATMRRLPGLRMGIMDYPGARLARTPELIADDDDVFCLAFEFGETSNASMRNRSVTLATGDAVLIHSMEPCVTTHKASRFVSITAPSTALALLVADIEDAIVRPIPPDNEALRLLPRYLRAVCDEMPLASPELRHLATTHVHDLMALAIGATRDGAALAQSRGLSAARITAVKADIIANLARPELSLSFIAKRQRLSERHIRRLFKAENTSFSEFVRAQRLLRAYRMLGDPRFADHAISAIAYECGFGDLSYFNRSFRRRFGSAPSGVRSKGGAWL